jgi:hypothetical protein
MTSIDDLYLVEEFFYGYLESSVSKYRGSSLTLMELVIVYSSNEGMRWLPFGCLDEVIEKGSMFCLMTISFGCCWNKFVVDVENF